MSVRLFQKPRDWRGTISYSIYESARQKGKRRPLEPFVIMGWWVLVGGPISIGAIAGADTLSEARSVIPHGYERIERAEKDPESVVESWV